MKKKEKKLYIQQKKRYLKKIIGTIERPRLAVFRSHKHIYAQLIDDKNGLTLAFSSTLDKILSTQIKVSSTQDAAFKIGEEIGKKANIKNIKSIIFDRGNRPYHGRIKSLAEGARSSGLIF
jgi:large subunit ribosomal protein L18